MRPPRIPKRAFWFAFASFALAPAAARVPAALVDPSEWRLAAGLAIVGAMLALVPAMAAAGAGEGNRDRPFVYWFTLAAGVGVQLGFYAQLAFPKGDHPGVGFAMLGITLISSVATLAAWLIAALAHRIGARAA